MVRLKRLRTLFQQWDRFVVVSGFVLLEIGYFADPQSSRGVALPFLCLLWFALASKIYRIVVQKTFSVDSVFAGMLVLTLNLPLHLFALLREELFPLNYLLVGFLAGYQGLRWGIFWAIVIWSLQIIPFSMLQHRWVFDRAVGFEGVWLLLFAVTVGYGVRWEREGSEKAKKRMENLEREGRGLRNPFAVSSASPLQSVSIEERKKHLVGAIYDLDERIFHILENLKRVVKAYSVVLYSVDPKSNKLYLREICSECDDIVAKGAVSVDDNILGAVFRQQRAIRIEDPHVALQSLPYYTRSPKIRALLAIPLVGRGISEGVLCVDSRNMHAFEPEDRRVLEVEAERIIDALEYAKVRHQLRSDSDQFAALNELSRILGKTLKLEEIAKFSLEAAKNMIDYDFGLIVLEEGGGSDYRVCGVLGLEEEEWKGSVFSRTESGIVAEILAQHQRPFPIPNLKERGQRRALFSKKSSFRDVASLLIIPLVSHQERVGGMILMSRKPAFFEDFESRFVELLGHQVSIAIENAKIHRSVEEMAITDGLTGLYNHRYFKQGVEQEFKRVERYKESFSLIMVDVDFFKRVNDQYGHPAGDELLRQMSALLRDQLREVDLIARYGGEEFVLLLPRANRRNAYQLAERLRKEVERRRFPIQSATADSPNGVGLHVTVSLGIATYPGDASNAAEMIARADRALYAAKEGGRNRTVPFHRLDRSSGPWVSSSVQMPKS